MSTLILLSIVLLSVALPIRLSVHRSPRQALRRTQWIIFAFVFVWAAMCILWYPRIQPLE